MRGGSIVGWVGGCVRACAARVVEDYRTYLKCGFGGRPQINKTLEMKVSDTSRGRLGSTLPQERKEASAWIANGKLSAPLG